jgi:hypothetical protein
MTEDGILKEPQERPLHWGPNRHIRQFALGAELPRDARFLGMHIEQRNDGLRVTPTPVFYYEVLEKP